MESRDRAAVSGWPKSPREIAADAVATFHEMMHERVPGYVANRSEVTVAIEAIVQTLVWQFRDYDAERRGEP